jgi:hypothetical protein
MIGAGIIDVCQRIIFAVLGLYLLFGIMFFFYFLIHGSFWIASKVNKKFGIWVDKKSEVNPE